MLKSPCVFLVDLKSRFLKFGPAARLITAARGVAILHQIYLVRIRSFVVLRLFDPICRGGLIQGIRLSFRHCGENSLRLWLNLESAGSAQLYLIQKLFEGSDRLELS
jgi:hypothetical protein